MVTVRTKEKGLFEHFPFLPLCSLQSIKLKAIRQFLIAFSDCSPTRKIWHQLWVTPCWVSLSGQETDLSCFSSELMGNSGPDFVFASFTDKHVTFPNLNSYPFLPLPALCWQHARHAEECKELKEASTFQELTGNKTHSER